MRGRGERGREREKKGWREGVKKEGRKGKMKTKIK